MKGKFKKFLLILNAICGVLVFVIGTFILATGLFISIHERVIPPVIISTPISIFLFYLVYYHFVINKTKLKNLTDKQEKFIRMSSVISIVVFSISLTSMLMAIIGCLIYGPLAEPGFFFCFIGVAVFSALLVFYNVLMYKIINK